MMAKKDKAKGIIAKAEREAKEISKRAKGQAKDIVSKAKREAKKVSEDVKSRESKVVVQAKRKSTMKKVKDAADKTRNSAAHRIAAKAIDASDAAKESSEKVDDSSDN